jgi:two-component system, NtrC family, sensor histidine kinase PilS
MQFMNTPHWHVRSRWLGSLGLALVAILAGDVVSTTASLLALCGAIALYNLLLLPSRLPGSSTGRYVLPVLCLDALTLTAYLHYTGDVESPVRFFYALPIIAASLLISIRAGLLMAGLATSLYGALLVLTWTDSFPIRLTHHHLGLFGTAFHDTIDPALSETGGSYLGLQAFRLGALVFGFAAAVGILGARVRTGARDLKVQHHRQELMLNLLREGVVLFSKDGRILLANGAAREFLPLGAAKRLDDLPSDLGVQERFARFQGPWEEFETQSRGRILYHRLVCDWRDGSVVWVFRDMTEQRRMMAELVHKSKMADMGLLAAGIAHEIGNPLSTMSATLEMLEMKSAPREWLDRLRPLESQISRIGRIVQDIQAFTRPSTGERRIVPVEDLLAEMRTLFRLHDKSRHVALEVAPSEAHVRIRVIYDQIVQVLLNLLLNAADSCTREGRIRVSFDHDDRDVRISVRDNGCGMTEEVRRHLFSPFFTTKEPGKGTGLGLFVSEAIVRAHGGRIEVSSSPGEGSTFTVCLARLPED